MGTDKSTNDVMKLEIGVRNHKARIVDRIARGRTWCLRNSWSRSDDGLFLLVGGRDFFLFLPAS